MHLIVFNNGNVWVSPRICAVMRVSACFLSTLLVICAAEALKVYAFYWDATKLS